MLMKAKIMDIRKVFNCFLIFNFVLWCVVPLWRLSLPMDTQEALVWGKYCLWGTTKHPPFSGWVAYPFYLLTGQIDKAVYILSPLCVLLGVWAIYKLARCFLSENQAIMAALLQFGIIYYDFSAVEFNVNVISVALWPLCALFFWRAYNNDKLQDWLLFGIFVALNLLNKYVSGVLLVSLIIFIITDKSVLKLLKNPKVYAAMVLCVLIVLPHLIWLGQNDFEMLNYIASRNHAGKITSFGRHIVYPLKFIGAQILFAAATFLIYGSFYAGSEKGVAVKNKTHRLFIGITAVAPVAIFALIGAVQGTPLKSMWGFPCLFMTGTALFYFFPMLWNEHKEKMFVTVIASVSLLFAVAYIAQSVLTTSVRFRTPVKKVAAELVQKYEQTKNKTLNYVGGNVWYANMVALYAGKEIKPMIWLSPKNNPWFDAADFEQDGALVVAENYDEYAAYRRQYRQKIGEPHIIRLELKNYFGKTKVKEVFYGFYEPKEDENAE